jgi:hypothetical protein
MTRPTKQTVLTEAMTDDDANRCTELRPVNAAITGAGLLEVEVIHLTRADHARSRSKVAPVYDVRVACRECGTQQSFRGTIPEIGDAAERWSNEHQPLSAHAYGMDAALGKFE